MPEIDPLIMIMREFVGVFMRRSMQNFILYSKETGLSMSQFGAMFQVMHKGTSGVTDLGDELGVTSAAASQMLERLVQQGLVTRSEDPHDRRVKQIVLSEKGRRILQESVHARQVWMDELVLSLSPAEREQVTATLLLLLNKTRELDAAPSEEQSPQVHPVQP